MVRTQMQHTRQKSSSKGFNKNRAKARKINASTQYETCTEQISPFGGLLALIKFLDLIDFKQIFNFNYHAPTRQPKLGHYTMVTGLLMLLFIGFNRIWHFTYIRLDAMLCGFFRLPRLPVASTFWRYVDSMSINQGQSLIKIMSSLRERVWKQLGLNYYRIHIDIDTTVETLYGSQQGARKGHNTKHRGKKGYRPVLCFIAQTREYLLGKLRKGTTISGEQTAIFIKQIKTQLPGCVKQVLLRADGEFLSSHSVQAAVACGFDFIIANSGCEPPFDPQHWYCARQHKDIEYNSCVYQPLGWQMPFRFVAMRIPKEYTPSRSAQPIQCELFAHDSYIYRIFCTSLSAGAHEVIGQYDKRADAVPSAKFKNNYAFFQVVMLAYNIWRYMKLMASSNQPSDQAPMKTLATNTIRIARLKLLFIAAKVVKDQNRDKVKYSIHDARTPAMVGFLSRLDALRSKPRPWVLNDGWPQRFTFET